MHMKAVTLLCCLNGSQSTVSQCSLFMSGLLLFLLYGIRSIDCSVDGLPFITTKLNIGMGVICFVSEMTCSAFSLNESKGFRIIFLWAFYFFSGVAFRKLKRAQEGKW